MIALTHYLATKPGGIVTVWLVIAVILFGCATIMALVDTTNRKWALLMSAGMIFFTLAFLT